MNTAFNREQNILLWLACSAIFFEAFDVSVVNLALPLMATDLRIPLATAQWVQTIYLLTFGGFLLLGGRLCDHYGSAVIFIAGMSLFACASALGYASRDIGLLLPARAGQGIGAALAMPAGISLLSRYFSGERQQWAFGIFGAFAAVGFAGGLAIGGVIATLADWHWIFGVNVPVIALVVVVARGHIPRSERLAGSPPNAWIAAWLTLTVLVLSGAVHEAARLGWWVLPCLAGSLLSGLFLLRVDRRLRRPFFGAGVYASREAYQGLAAFALLGAGFLPFVFTCTLGLGVCLGQGILATGLWLFPFSIGSALVSKYLLPRLYRRMSPRQVGLLAMGLLLAGDILLAAGIHGQGAGWFLGALLLVNSISIAIGYPAFTVLSLSGVPPERQGVAAGIQSTLYTVASGLGLSFISLCLDALGPASTAASGGGPFGAGTTRNALLACCGIVGVLCLAGLVILVRNQKRRTFATRFKLLSNMATVTRENIGLLTDKITVNVSKGDYLPSFEKTLKQYGKQANIPGFRKGMVPAGLIKKMYGNSVFTEEVLRTVEKELTTYMSSEKLEIFAQPLPLGENDARQIDINNPADYSFAFEIGLKPAFNLADLATAKVTRLKVEVTPEMIDEEVDRQRNRNGKMVDQETVANDENVLNLHFTETNAAGEPVEGGIQKDNSLLVKYFNEATRPKWIGLKKGDFQVLQPSAAFDEKEREWVLGDLGIDKHDAAGADKYFKVEITKVGLIEKPELNEEFFKTAYPGKEIKTETEFRDAVKEDIQAYWDNQSRNQFQHGLYHILLDQTKIEFPEDFLKRWMQTGGEQPKSHAEVEEEFPQFVNQLKWTLIVDKVTRENNIEVAPEDIQAFAKQQLFGYMGMPAGAEEQPWVADYIQRMMKDRKFVEDTANRIQTEKVFAWAETQINPTDKPVSKDEFTHLVEEHQHHHH